MASCVTTLRKRERLLVDGGSLALMLAAGTLALGLTLDTREVMGINPWIKPSKFLISFWIYFWTVGWLLARLEAPAGARPVIRQAVFWTMLLEGLLIGLQSARGVPSHFNVSTSFDVTVYRLMGMAVGVNTLAIVALLLLYLRPQGHLDTRFLRGIRAGLVVFLLGCLATVPMILEQAHTVGAPDGGPGLPYLNWSLEHGDLRPVHFVGIHGLQALPLLGSWAARHGRTAGSALFGAGLCLYLGLFMLVTFQAFDGRPLITWSQST